MQRSNFEPTRSADQDRLDSAIKLVGSGLAARATGTVVGVIGGFATTSLAVRLLGLESYGVLALGLSMLAIVAALANSGLALATVQQAAASPEGRSGGSRTTLVHGALTAGVLVGIAGGAVLVVILYLRSVPVEPEERALFAIGLGLLLVGRTVAAVALSALRGFGRVWLTEIPNALLLIGQVGVVSVAFLTRQAHAGIMAGGFGAVGLVAALISVAIVRYGVLGSERLAWSFSAARQMLAVAWPLAIVAVAMQVLARMDVVILGVFRPLDEVGAYEPTLRLVDRLMQMTPLLLMAAYLPASTRLNQAADLNAVRRLYRTTAKVGYVVGFLPLLLLVSFPDTALRFLYGSDFPVLHGVVAVLLVGYGFNAAVGLNTTTLISLRRNRETALIYSSVFAVVVASALALIPAYGAAGAAVSTTLGYLTLNAVISIALYRYTRVHVFGKDVVLTLLTSLPALMAGIVASLLWDISNIFVAGTVATAIWGLWVAGLFGLRTLSRHELRAFVVRKS